MIEWFKNLFCKHEYVLKNITDYYSTYKSKHPYITKEHYQCKKCLKLKKVEI